MGHAHGLSPEEQRKEDLKVGKVGFGILLLVQGFFPKEKELIKEKIENLSPR